jgi:putative nucleotidyltransferase with HDIG domain
MNQSSPSPMSIPERLVRDLARGTSDLPTLPRGVAEALRLARKPALDFSEIERVGTEYPPLAARLLAVANSALYALPGVPRIASVRRAAIRLGLQATRDVLYQVAYATMFVDTPRFREIIERSFLQGVRAARYARFVATERRVDVDVAFLAGLLHDIGRARCWKLIASMKGTIDEQEAEAAVDEHHTQAGAQLATAWRLPDEVVDACRWHHEPGGRVFPTLAAAAHAFVEVEDGVDGAAEAASRHLEALGFAPERVQDLLAATKVANDEAGAPQRDSLLSPARSAPPRESRRPT